MVKLVTQFDNFKTETRLATPTCCGVGCSCCCCCCVVTVLASGIVTARYFTVRTRPPKWNNLTTPIASDVNQMTAPDVCDPTEESVPMTAQAPSLVSVEPSPSTLGRQPRTRLFLILMGALLGIFTGIAEICIAVTAGDGFDPTILLFSMLPLAYFPGLFYLAKRHRVLPSALIFTVATAALLIAELFIWLWGFGLT